jgi:hypothetical protein
MSRVRLLSAGMFVVVVLAEAWGCAHETKTTLGDTLEEARTRARDERTAATAVAWSDAVGEAVKAGLLAEDASDVVDVTNRLRAEQASVFGEDVEPLAAARARLLFATGKEADADAAWVEAARAKPTPQNLDALFAAARRNKDVGRLRALCAVGPIALPANDLPRWLERCSNDAGLEQNIAASSWTATDRARLAAGAELVPSTPLDVCLHRCRPALYRSVAACQARDDRCLKIASQTFDVCETNCHEVR